jgi:hypothetical protein
MDQSVRMAISLPRVMKSLAAARVAMIEGATSGGKSSSSPSAVAVSSAASAAVSMTVQIWSGFHDRAALPLPPVPPVPPAPTVPSPPPPPPKPSLPSPSPQITFEGQPLLPFLPVLPVIAWSRLFMLPPVEVSEPKVMFVRSTPDPSDELSVTVLPSPEIDSTVVPSGMPGPETSMPTETSPSRAALAKVTCVPSTPVTLLKVSESGWTVMLTGVVPSARTSVTVPSGRTAPMKTSPVRPGPVTRMPETSRLLAIFSTFEPIVACS